MGTYECCQVVVTGESQNDVGCDKTPRAVPPERWCILSKMVFRPQTKTDGANPATAEIGALLRSAHTIAVVGVSARPERDSHDVALYLVRHGYRVIPVNPALTELLGEVAYPDVASIPAALEIDIVDIFRRPEFIPAIVDQAIARGAKAVWMQLGLADEASARRARAAGLTVVMDRCIKVDHARLAAQSRS